VKSWRASVTPGPPFCNHCAYAALSLTYRLNRRITGVEPVKYNGQRLIAAVEPDDPNYETHEKVPT
jgi:hypothetical protein